MSEKKYEYVRKTARYNGKKYTATGNTEAEAIMKLADKLTAAKRGEETIGGSMTVDAWFEKWVKTYKEPKGLTQKSLGMYREKYSHYISPAIGRMKMQSVTEIHLQVILNEQSDKSTSHVKKIRLVMQEMFRRARQARIIPYDPAELLELPATTQRKRRAITPTERSAILAIADTHRCGLWILTLLYTGMRPGETAALKWKDVDFERNVINVTSAKESGSQKIKAPKTAAGIRTIPIHAYLRDRLLQKKGSPDSPVFPTMSGGWQNENSMRRLWTGFRRDLDIQLGAETYRNKIIHSVIADDLTPYCLRHTFCTDMLSAGVPLAVVKEIMGHSDISITANVYTHPTSGDAIAAMKALEVYQKSKDEILP